MNRKPFANLGPNWFASIMGTGIVANAAATLPIGAPALRPAGTVVWLLAATMLVAMSMAWIVHWVRHRATALGHAHDPVMAQFWGAPPMALMTVGAGTLLLGRDWIGLEAAVRIDTVLWVAGTVLGLVTAVWIPYQMITRHTLVAADAFGGWLMPVVPPMVSAATGALLVPYAPADARAGLLYACYAMFGMSLLATLALLPQIWSRLVTADAGPARMVPTIWIVLGPIGQSVTAAGSLGAASALVLPAPYASAAPVVGVFYGVPAIGFGMMWLALATAVTIRCAPLPFGLPWWSFTFPVGTMVTGASSLAAHTHVGLFRYLAVGLYALLVVAWLLVFAKTAVATYRGTIFPPPTVPTPAAAPGRVPAAGPGSTSRTGRAAGVVRS